MLRQGWPVFIEKSEVEKLYKALAHSSKALECIYCATSWYKGEIVMSEDENGNWLGEDCFLGTSLVLTALKLSFLKFKKAILPTLEMLTILAAEC